MKIDFDKFNLKQTACTIIIFACFSVLLTAFDWPWDKWTGFFYVNGDTFNVRRGGPFKTKEACLAWAEEQVKSTSDDFECGKNCKPSSTGQLMICDVTVDS